MPATTNVIIFFDFETGGLDPAAGAEPIEIAAIALDGNTFEEIGRFPARLMWVREPKNLGARALEVNGKTVEQIMRDGENPEEVLMSFIAWTVEVAGVGNRPKLAGHNVKFDIGFLKQMFKDYAPDFEYEKFYDYHDVCSHSVFYFQKVLVEQACLKSSLVNASALYGIPHVAHEAMGDVEAGVEVLRKLRTEQLRRVKLEQLAKAAVTLRSLKRAEYVDGRDIDPVQDTVNALLDELYPQPVAV